MRCKIILILLTVLSGSVLLASCSKEQKQPEADGGMAEHGMSASWKFTLPQGDPVEGRKTFVESECYKCHEVKGETFPAVAVGEKGVGSELSQMAGMHPVEFFAESVMNPNAVMDPDAKGKGYLGDDGKSKMFDYSDSFIVKQIVDVAVYLASLKGGQQKTR